MATNITTTIATGEMSPDFILNVFYWEQIILAIIVGLVAIGGLIGNIMIIVAVSFSKKLQTSTNVFVTSLSVADLLTAFTAIWYAVSVLGKGEWPIPGADWLCQFTGFVIYASFLTSTWILGVIAINRLIFIVKPFWYNKIFISWKLVFLVAIPWIIPTACLLILDANGNVSFGYNKYALFCGFIKFDHKFNLGTSIIGLLFPLPAIVISYIWIYLFIRNHFRKQKQYTAPVSSVNSAPPEASMQNSTSVSDLVITEKGTRDPNSAVVAQRRKRISNQEIEITKNLFYVVVGFFVSLIPYSIAVQLRPSPTINHILFYMKILPLFNMPINFVIYAAKHPDFKVVLGHMMRRSYAEIPEPTPLLRYLLSDKN